MREPSRPGLTKDAALVSDLLKLLLKICAKEAGVAAKLIARSDELEALAAGVRNGLNILDGWRFEEFGRDALDLVEGRLGFATENGKLKMSRLADNATVDSAPDRRPGVSFAWPPEGKSMRNSSQLAFLPLAACTVATSGATADSTPAAPAPCRGEALAQFIGRRTSAWRTHCVHRAKIIRWVPKGGVVTMDFSRIA